MKLDSLMNDCRAMIENFSIRVASAAFAEHHVSLLCLEELACLQWISGIDHDPPGAWFRARGPAIVIRDSAIR